MNNLCNLSHVEQVVSFSGEWQQHFDTLLVNLNRQVCHRNYLLLPARGVGREAPLKNLCEYTGHSLFRHIREVEKVKMPQQSHAWQGTASSRSSHRAEEDLTHDFRELKSLFVIKAIGIHDLSHHFEGRLCSKLLFKWHIEIIDEDQKVIIWILWAINALLVLFKFTLSVLLDLLWRGCS